MIFKRLELKNFKSHEDTIIDFNNGITLIIGENGAGKSSIFEAINFALFKPQSFNDLFRKGGNNTLEVKLTFNANGVEYRVERRSTLNKSGVSSDDDLFEITDDDEIHITSGANEVREFIKQILRMDSKTFSNAIHIKQGEIDDLVTKTAANRKTLISKLLKIDDLEKAFSNMNEIIKDMEYEKKSYDKLIMSEDELNSNFTKEKENQDSYNEKISELQQDITNKVEKLELKSKEKEKLDSIKSQIDDLKYNYSTKDEHLTYLNNQKEDLTNNYNQILEFEKKMGELKPYCDKLGIFINFKDLLAKFNNLNNEKNTKNEIISKIDENKEIISKEKENHDKYLKLEEEINELRRLSSGLNSMKSILNKYELDKIKLEKDIDGYSKKLDGFYSKIVGILVSHDIDFAIDDFKSSENLEKMENIVIGAIDNIKNKIEDINNDIKDKDAECIKFKGEIENNQKPLDEIKQAGSKCPTCQSDITEEKKEELIDYYETKISTNQQKITDINDFINDLVKIKESYNQKLDELNSINDFNQYKSIFQEINKRSPDLIDINNEILETEEKLSNLEGLSNEINTKILEQTNLKAHYENYNNASGFLNIQEDESKIKNELDILSNEINEIKAQLESIINSYSNLSLDINIDDLNSYIASYSDKNNEYNRLKGSVSKKEDYENKLKANEHEIDLLIKEMESIIKSIDNFDYDEVNHESVSKLVKDLESNINESKRNLAIKEVELKNSMGRLSDLKEKIKENQKYKDESIAITDYINLLKDFKKLYSKDNVQAKLRLETVPDIGEFTSQFFEKFNFNYTKISLNDDFSIIVNGPDDTEVDLKMISGGEKIAIALSLRLAITQVMSKGNIETILLDEPTIHLDSYRRQELINVLRTLTIIPQMIIVTHDEELENAASRIIKIRKEDGISIVEEE